MIEIKFKAYIPDLDIILEDITLYGNGQMGFYEDDFVESLPDKYTYDPDMGGVLLIDNDNDIFETILTPLYGENWIWLEKNQFIPMQFTGLYDKNNNPIYKGDIVLLFNKLGEGGNLTFVVENDGLGFYLRQKNNMLIRTFFEIVEHDWQIEIIGNIHQNKNLLK